MSRFRISNAPSEEDRRIALCLDKAEREIEAAYSIVRSSRFKGFAVRRLERDLSRVLASLQDVGHLSSRKDDPDSVSEEERSRRYRQKLEEERLAKKASASSGGVNDES